MQPLITKKFLFASFAGEATTLQKEMIEDWAKQPANEDFFYQCLHEWEIQHPSYSADLPAAIQKFLRRILLPAEGLEQ